MSKNRILRSSFYPLIASAVTIASVENIIILVESCMGKCLTIVRDANLSKERDDNHLFAIHAGGTAVSVARLTYHRIADRAATSIS